MDYQKKIQKLIDSLGFNKNKDFAEAIGASPARISNYVNGRSVPDFEFFELLKKAFPQVDIDAVFTDEEFVTINTNNLKKIEKPEDTDTLSFLKRQLQEKDKQIERLMNLLKPSQATSGGL